MPRNDASLLRRHRRFAIIVGSTLLGAAMSALGADAPASPEPAAVPDASALVVPPGGKFGSSTTRLDSGEVVEGTGSHLRTVMDQAYDARERGDAAEAVRLYGQVAAWCDQQRRDHKGPVLATSRIEDREVLAARVPPGSDILWVDMACATSHQQIAFLFADRGDGQTALAELTLATAYAPLWAEAYTERGYVLNQLGRSNDALGSYLTAVELARTYPSSRYVLPLALRGLGFTQIELGELDEAEKLFKESLELDPGNKVAENELLYIEQVRAERSSAGAPENPKP